MTNSSAKKIIEELEDSITKEIEKTLYFGLSDYSVYSICNWIFACMGARKQIQFEPLYTGVRNFLEVYKYDDDFINNFILVSSCIKQPNSDSEDYIEAVLQIFENYLVKELKKSVYGGGDKSCRALYFSIQDCIEVSKESHKNYSFNSFLSYFRFPAEFKKLLFEKIDEENVKYGH